MQHGEMCEHNVTEQLFADPQHPYTRRLLASEPRGRPQPLPEGSGTILEANGVRVCFMLRHGAFRRALIGSSRSTISASNFAAMRRWGWSASPVPARPPSARRC